MRLRKMLVRRGVEVLLAIMLVLLLGCGYKTPSNGNSSGNPEMANGTVSLVALTSVNNGTGGLATATAVTLSVPLGTNSLVLCGDQRASFTMNTVVQVSFTNGTYCSNLVSVTRI